MIVAHFSLHLALCNSLNLIRTKISHVIEQFPQIQAEKFKVAYLTENWYTWYLGGGDSKSRHRFWKFRSQNPFQVNLGRKSQSCLFCLKIGTHAISRMLILIPTIVFSISKPKSFLGKFRPKKSKLSILAESYLFFTKMGTHIVSRGC